MCFFSHLKMPDPSQAHRVSPFDDLLIKAPALVGAVIAGAGVYARITEIGGTIKPDQIHFSTVAPVILLLLSIWLGFAWYAAGKQELRTFKNHLGACLPSEDFTGLPIVTLVILLLATMVYFSEYPAIFCGAFFLYHVLAVVTFYAVRSEAREVLKKGESVQISPRIIAIFRGFYFNGASRVWLELIASGFAWWFADRALQAPARQYWNIRADILVIVTVAGGEGWIWIRRYQFYRELADAVGLNPKPPS